MSTPPPPLDTNTGAGAITSRSSRTGTITLTAATGFPRTSTTSGISAFTGPTTYPIVSRYPVRVTQSGVVYISTATITLSPFSGRPQPTAVEHHSGTNRGAIAGGVIGACAVIIAIVATLLWFRRRSPAHWKAKSGRGWRNIGGRGGKPPLLPTDGTQAQDNDFFNSTSDDKAKFPDFQRHSVTDLQRDNANPFKDPEVEAPPPALYIREHRQPVQDPFSDPPESPTRPRPTHKRGASSINPLLPSINQ